MIPGDYLVLTREAVGRRVSPQDPGRSLLLSNQPCWYRTREAVALLDSREYQVISQWIAEEPSLPAKPIAASRHSHRARAGEVAPGHAPAVVVTAMFNDGYRGRDAVGAV
jgi:hypothetical protein